MSLKKNKKRWYETSGAHTGMQHTPLPHAFNRLQLWFQRWVNLWWRADFAENITSGACAVDDVALFMGNSVLVSCCFLGIFLVHVAVISAIEAFWVVKVSCAFVESGRRSTDHRGLHLLAALPSNTCGANHSIHGLSTLEAMIRIGCQV